MARVLWLWILAIASEPAFSAVPLDNEWVPVYRIYGGDGWNSYSDYVSQERSAKNSDEDEAQFRSYYIDQWNNHNIQKVRVELFNDGYRVVDMEFNGANSNSTTFFSAKSLKRSHYDDLPSAAGPGVYAGDGFSIEGDGNYRHWIISGRHVSNCRTDEGWFQIIDKPKPGRDVCICGYENREKLPVIMYSKSKRKTKWSAIRNVGYADMMQVSVSMTAYPPEPVTPDPMQQYFQQQQYLLQQQQPQTISQTNMWMGEM